MKNAPVQPEITKVKTLHTITYKGHVITIKGAHEQKFNRRSKMRFSFNWGNGGLTFGVESSLNLRDKLDQCVSTIKKNKTYVLKSDAFRALHLSLSSSEKIAHPNFAYSRFQLSSMGNYYNIYWKSELSPTGFELVGGCTETEWKSISNATGNENNYLSPSESRMTGR